MGRSSDFSENGDTLLYADNTFRLMQDSIGNTYYQAKCGECDTWFDVEFNDIIHSINGLEVGYPDSPIVVEYPHKVNATIGTCETCGYIHIYDSREYVEITDFETKNIKESCFYNISKSAYGRLTYKISEAELIAKYILSLVSQAIFMVEIDDGYFKILKKLIIGNKIFEPCLVSVIMCDIIDENKYSDDVFDKWCVDGLDALSVTQLEHCNKISELLL